MINREAENKKYIGCKFYDEEDYPVFDCINCKFYDGLYCNWRNREDKKEMPPCQKNLY